jgi:isopentenyldiphosphate isomerase
VNMGNEEYVVRIQKDRYYFSVEPDSDDDEVNEDSNLSKNDLLTLDFEESFTFFTPSCLQQVQEFV